MMEKTQQQRKEPTQQKWCFLPEADAELIEVHPSLLLFGGLGLCLLSLQGQ